METRSGRNGRRRSTSRPGSGRRRCPSRRRRVASSRIDCVACCSAETASGSGSSVFSHRGRARAGSRAPGPRRWPVAPGRRARRLASRRPGGRRGAVARRRHRPSPLRDDRGHDEQHDDPPAAPGGVRPRSRSAFSRLAARKRRSSSLELEAGRRRPTPRPARAGRRRYRKLASDPGVDPVVRCGLDPPPRRAGPREPRRPIPRTAPSRSAAPRGPARPSASGSPGRDRTSAAGGGRTRRAPSSRSSARDPRLLELGPADPAAGVARGPR